MATVIFLSLLLLFVSTRPVIILSKKTTHHHPSSASFADFIRTSCKSTRYPSLCARTLTSYAPQIQYSHRTLATTALSVSLRNAKSACSFIDHLLANPTKKMERSAKRSQRYARDAAKDCIETMRDGVYRIRQSIKEMSHMGRAGSSQYGSHVSNVQTWVSAALTDGSTCLVGMNRCRGISRSVKVLIRRKILGVAKITSNALALVNKVA